MPISEADFMKGAKGQKISGGKGMGTKILAGMQPKKGYSADELTKIAGVDEFKKIKNSLNFLTYRKKLLEKRTVNGVAYWLKLAAKEVAKEVA